MPNQHRTFLPGGRRSLTLLLALGLLVPAISALADDFVIAGPGSLTSVPLPTGSESSELTTLDAVPRQIAYLDDGRLLAVRKDEPAGPVILYEVQADGAALDLGNVTPPSNASESPMDLVVDSLGRLFLLTHYSEMDYFFARILQLDPADASIVTNHGLPLGLGGPVPRQFARAPEGLWVFTDNGLEHYDPDSQAFTFRQTMNSSVAEAEADSTGLLWLWEGGSSFARLDPATGALQTVAAPLNPEGLAIRDIAIRRGCQESDSRLCLQAGRFQVDVTWRDFEGGEGQGRLTSARSTDSGVFWFFHPANWELMVKVLDACGFNDKFWVFSSGSTNVQYEMRVTDLATGTVRIYDNPLGTIAETVTDTAAFDCE